MQKKHIFMFISGFFVQNTTFLEILLNKGQIRVYNYLISNNVTVTNTATLKSCIKATI